MSSSESAVKPAQRNALALFGSAAIAATASEVFTFPLDSVKTWMQAQKMIRPNQTFYRYPSGFDVTLWHNPRHQMGNAMVSKLFQKVQRGSPAMSFGLTSTGFRLSTSNKESIKMIRKVMAKDGISTLYRGISLGICRNSLASALTMVLCGPVNDMLPSNLGEMRKPVACTLVAMSTVTVLSPLELLKTRIQVDSMRYIGSSRNKSIVQSFVSLKEKQGIKGFWAGAYPGILRSGIWQAFAIPTYDGVKKGLVSRFGYHKDSTSTHLLTSIISGFIAGIASHPVDVVKTRLQVQSLKSPRYTGTWDCISRILKREGPKGLLRGFSARYLRLGPYQVIYFLVFEQILMATSGESFSL